MPHDVEDIEVCFIAYRTANVKEARELEVKATEMLLKMINSHEPIRPYLREYPFKPNRAHVSISFRQKNNAHQSQNSLAYVSQGENKIFYSINDTKTDRLVTFHEEPYEEALKIVQNQSPPEKF